MCLIFLAHRIHPRYRLALAANRDEFYRRPTAPIAPWNDFPEIVAGRDEEGGGTWLGIAHRGRWGAVTNFRDRAELAPHQGKSRGLLVVDLLRESRSLEDFFGGLATRAGAYRGFNLLGGDDESLWYHSNRNGPPRRLEPGHYGLGNHLLDTPWPKLTEGKKAFIAELERSDLNIENLFQLLSDTSRPPDDRLPDTGFGIDWERILSSRFIRSPEYGTRSSTVLLIEYSGKTLLVERTYDRHPDSWREVRIER